MVIYLLWTALVFFVVASFLPQQYKLQRLPIGAIGWVVFAGHLGLEPIHYLEESDFTMILLMLFAAFLCIIVAHLMFITYLQAKKGNTTKDLVNRENDLLILTKITALGCLFYFPFAQIPSLNHLIISTVASHTVWLSNLVGFPVERIDWNLMTLEGYRIEIILACTAIESIALFIGIILGTRAELKRIIMALMASVPVIYILNLIRNTFVVGAFGYQWFGTGPMIINIFGKEFYLHDSASFFLSHHIIAKIGSGIALFFIAYAVLILLPEVLYLIDSLWLEIKKDINRILRGD
ncbi:MAG: archaeosortase A [Methanosarcinales archaeon]|nr:archaeosortase A [Methanosarcinales archaeon]